MPSTKDTDSAFGKTEPLYSVRAECHQSCRKDRVFEAVVPDYQMFLVALLAHTQHGGCGLKVQLDGVDFPLSKPPSC